MSRARLWILILLGFVVVAICPFIPRGETASSSHEFWLVLIKLRVPRILQGFFVGAALSLAGLLVQSICRNPLASPYTLGIASGGAFGVALLVATGAFAGFWSGGLALQGSSFLGALGAGVLSLGIARNLRSNSSSIILAGVIVSFFFSSLVVLLQYISDLSALFTINRWLLGDLQVVGYSNVVPVMVVSLGALVVSLLLADSLDIAALGESLGTARGVDVSRLQMFIFLLVSIVTAQVVACAGPIGFVGIMVPNIVRCSCRAVHRALIPASFIAGGVFLVLCDQAGLLLLSPVELPVGVVTALLGGPFFLFLLVRRSVL